MIRVDSTRVSGTLIWNVADTSVSELERFCSVGSIETPGLELASLPSLLSFTQRGSPASTASPAQGWRCGCSPLALAHAGLRGAVMELLPGLPEEH